MVARAWMALVLAMLLAGPACGLPAAEEPSQEEVAALIGQLDSDDFDTREKAVPQLIALGASAIEAVGKAALSGAPETRFRAVTVLAALSRSRDEATSAAAEKALRKIAGGDDIASARQAKEALAPFARLEKMRQLAESFALFESDDGKPKNRLPVSEKHLQRFVDTERSVADGTLWSFGKSGRPLAVIEVFPMGASPAQDVWYSAVASLTTRVLIAEKVDGVEGQNWTPGPWGQKFQPLPKSSDPASSQQERGFQMSQLARRFTAHQFWRPGETRFDLAVVAEPVLRYQDEKAGIADGGLFIVVHETNPEVLLLIEAQVQDGKSQWVYALAPLGSARMHVELDQEEVWTCPTPTNVAGGGTQPYWVFARRPAEAK